MTPIINMPIDDNLLAAYLDGRLDEKQNEYVENAIENSPELQWTVDRWLESQTKQISPTETEIGIQQAVGIKPGFKQFLSYAASILLIVAFTVPFIIKLGDVNPNSGMSQGFPASNNRIPLEHSTNGNPSIIDPNSVVVADKPFSWRYEIYNEALIIMWKQRMETFHYKLYSSDGREMASGYTTNSHSAAISLSTVAESDKPLWLSVKFRGTGVIENDSIMINY